MAVLRLIEADTMRRLDCDCHQCTFRMSGNAFMAGALGWVMGNKALGGPFEKAMAQIRDDETTAKYLHKPKTA